MVVAAILGYLIGSIPTAQIVARRVGVDPLADGDGNPGWWNMRGLAGDRVAAVVLVLDVLKGMAAAGVGLALWGPWWVAYVAVFFAMVGHAFPAFAGLRGGRSVLTWAGGMLVLNPAAVGFALLAGAVIGGVSRSLSWGLRVAAFSFPLFLAAFVPAVEVAVTGILMTFIGLRFLAAHLSSAIRKKRPTARGRCGLSRRALVAGWLG